MHFAHLTGAGFGAHASRFFAVAGAGFVARGLLLHLLQRFVQKQCQVVERGHHVLLVGGHLTGFAVAHLVQGFGHVLVHQADFAVDRCLELNDALGEGKQAVFHHLGVVLEFALPLGLLDVLGIVGVDAFDGGHQVLLVKAEGDDVFQQCAQGFHVLFHALLLAGLHGLVHLLGHLLHLLGGLLLGLRGFLLLVFFELVRALLHFLLDLLLLLLGVGHGVGILELFVHFLELLHVFLELVKLLVQLILLLLELVVLLFVLVLLGFLGELFLLFGQLFELVDGLFHLLLPLHLLELLQGALEFFLEVFLAEVHFLELFLDLVFVEFLHHALEFLVHLAHLLAHDFVHQLLELLLLFENVFVGLVELVLLLVFLLVFAGQLVHLLLEFLLLFEQLFQAFFVLPGQVFLLQQLSAQVFEVFVELFGLVQAFFQLVLDVFALLIAGVFELIHRRRIVHHGARAGAFAAVHPVVVVHLKEVAQGLSGLDAQLLDVDEVVELL